MSRVFRFDDFAKALAFTTARLVDEGVRMVFVNGALNSLSVPSVAVDEVFAGERATQHLLELEHTRIGRTGLLSPHAGEGSRTRAGPTSRGLERGLGVWSTGWCGGCFGRERQDRRV